MLLQCRCILLGQSSGDQDWVVSFCTLKTSHSRHLLSARCHSQRTRCSIHSCQLCWSRKSYAGGTEDTVCGMTSSGRALWCRWIGNQPPSCRYKSTGRTCAREEGCSSAESRLESDDKVVLACASFRCEAGYYSVSSLPSALTQVRRCYTSCRQCSISSLGLGPCCKAACFSTDRSDWSRSG